MYRLGTEMLHELETRILPRVSRPGRYTGGELNSARKNWDSTAVRMALAFPDAYEVGMSNLGFQIVYHLVNSIEYALCERVFAPWPDMEKLLSGSGIPLFSLESRSPLSDFNILGFSLGYELGYTNILSILSLGGITLRAAGRSDAEPIVIGGGCCCYNPEPVADFFDLFLLGEAEEILPDFIERFKSCKESGAGRQEIIRALAGTPGVYAPSLYSPSYSGGVFQGMSPATNAALPVSKRFTANLDTCFLPDSPVQPCIEAVHDRANVELFRGCARGCRFCHAGMVYRPVRERSPQRVLEASKALYASTGSDEISLLSFNSTDYCGLDTALETLDEFAAPLRVSISMPSTRLDTFGENARKRLRSVRPTGLTFAPEAATQRLRDAINKQITEEEMMSALSAAFSAGWNKVKLYFMIGLPTETLEDVEEIPRLVDRMLALARIVKGKRGKSDFTVSVSNFVPKAHTPFQWDAMDSPETLREKQRIVRRGMNLRRVKLDTHGVEVSILEGVFSRGGRELSRVIERAFVLGCRFDGWTEHFDYPAWEQAFTDASLNPGSFYAKSFSPGDALPWGHISCGISTDFLWREREKTGAGTTTPWCGSGGPCSACGLGCERNTV